eukprot:Transcript_11476.p2 GENE.Transcript_11476~~Transcript_11476.p2  ORF type:complete len:221 (-),score=37.90 Transcript_11476:97-759(-)
MTRIRHSASAADRYRFIVVMREPMARAFSEWRMFALKYRWERDRNFTSVMARKAAGLRRCDPSLFRAPRRLRALSTEVLARYIRRCFGGGRAMQYLATSLYAVCIEHALRLFGREQFLFLRYEDLEGMTPTTLIQLLARFTGLSAEGALRSKEATRRCTMGAKAPKRGPTAAKAQLAAAVSELGSLFGPYNQMLARMVHPAFTWSYETANTNAPTGRRQS